MTIYTFDLDKVTPTHISEGVTECCKHHYYQPRFACAFAAAPQAGQLLVRCKICLYNFFGVQMITIDTAQKDWQKIMEASMSKKEKFLLITTDKKLAESLEKNEFNVGVLKLILIGSTATAVGAATISAGVSGLSGIAVLASSTALLSLLDPEPVSKIVLAVIAGICFSLGAYFVYRLVKMLISGKYRFRLKYKKYKDENGNEVCEWVYEAVPA